MTDHAAHVDLLSDFAAYRSDFSILSRTENDKPLVYLDSTATSQKPDAVLAAMNAHYVLRNANVHRGAYQLGAEATEAYEDARETLASFVGAPRTDEVIFTRNTTEGINLVAYAWGLSNLRPGDEIVVTQLEHHSNLVPWHLAAQLTGARVKAARMTKEGRLDLDSLADLLTSGRVRMVAVAHVSNALGTVHPVSIITRLAHDAGALCLVDGAQGAPHLPVNVAELGADFYALSGHKMLGPTGIGVLWGRHDLLRSMPPFLGGGEMIRDVFEDASTYAEPPMRFEAGTPAIAEAVGLATAARYLAEIGMDRVLAHEQALLAYALERIADIPGLETYGPLGEDRAGVLAFNLSGVHPHDVASFLDEDGVTVRAGHHCAQPAMRALGVDATVRASFALYNTLSDVDTFAAALRRCATFFAS